MLSSRLLLMGFDNFFFEIMKNLSHDFCKFDVKFCQIQRNFVKFDGKKQVVNLSNLQATSAGTTGEERKRAAKVVAGFLHDNNPEIRVFFKKV